MGIWFDSDLISRKEVNPGISTFGTDVENSPTNFFGYPGSQIVPYYKWKINNNGLFGTELNTWDTGAINSANYQNSPLDSSGYVVPSYSPLLWLYIQCVLIVTKVILSPNPGQSVKVGNPYHFYFGLKKGRTTK